MHIEIEPAIHYWGTPVVLVSTRNEDESANLAPMSSAWWLGWSCMLGLDASSQTVANLQRERECVLNLASLETADAVNRLARTTGSRSVPLHKKLLGYRHIADKAAHASLTLDPSEIVRAPRVRECLVQLEAQVVSIRPFAQRDDRMPVPACAVELQIRKVHLESSLRLDEDRVDPHRWRPLLMSFRELFVMGEPAVPTSRLASGEESAYAPWKRGRLVGWASRALGALAQRRYGVPEEDPG